MGDYKYIVLKEMPSIKERAAEWFHSKWGVPAEAQLECMDEYLSGETEYGWYLCLDGDKIIAGKERYIRYYLSNMKCLFVSVTIWYI